MREAMVPPSFRYFELIGRLKKTLAAGVTTVRDLMGVDVGRQQCRRVRHGRGPLRLLVADRMLSQTGGHADWHLASNIDGTALVGGDLVDLVDEARRAARVLLREHVDVIKIASSGGVTSMSDEPGWLGFRTEMVAAVVEEGKNYGGVPVAAHAIGYAGIRAAVEGGVHSVEHGYEIDDELRAQMVKNGQFLVPNSARRFTPTRRPRRRQQRARSGTRWRISRSPGRSRRASTSRAGLRGPCSRSRRENLGEIPLLVQYGGMTPMPAIVAGTKTSAECCGVDDKLGTIEAGKIADIVVVAGDPLTDISAVADNEKILLVMKQGHAAVNRGAFSI